MNRQVFIDTETTGLSAAKGHRIVELAAVEAVNGQITGRILHSYLDPERSIDPYAQRVHGISQDMLMDKPRFAHIAQDLVEFLRRAECLMHNAPFDSSFIDAELEMAGVSDRIRDIGKVTCTMQLARARFPGEKVTLDALMERSGVRGLRQKHSALDDAKLLAHVYFSALEAGAKSMSVRLPVTPPAVSSLPSSSISPAMIPIRLRMEKVIELVQARQETFYYRNKHKRIIDYRVMSESRWKRIGGPLLYAVTDASGMIRYIGKWEGATALYSRWLRHDTIHHAERTRNEYIRELDAGRGALEVWSISVKELKAQLPKQFQAWDEVRLAANLEGLWIRYWKNQLLWNKRMELVEDGFTDGMFWK